MERAASIEWARKNTVSKVADWMEAEELDIGTLISCTTEELKEAMPFQLNPITFNRLVVRLKQGKSRLRSVLISALTTRSPNSTTVQDNEENIVEEVQKGMQKLSLEASPVLAWSEPMRNITAPVAAMGLIGM